jgi:hypothetical protein
MEWRAVEVAAFLGAGAWIPQVASWIAKAATKPTLTIIPDKAASIGFTTYGPIFNLHLALAVDKKDTILTKLKVNLRHDAGDQREFTWRGMTETFSAIRDQSGIQQGRIEKDQAAIALKITTANLTEKFFRFQEDRFEQHISPILKEAVKHKNYLESQDPHYHDTFLRSERYRALVDAHRECFWWRAGKYEVRFLVQSTQRPRVVPPMFEFDLTQTDVDFLESNLRMIDPSFEQQVKEGLPDYTIQRIAWAWRDPILRAPKT